MQPEAFLLIVGVAFGTLLVIMVAIALRRLAAQDPSATAARLDELQRSQERTERVLTDEIARNREESGTQAKQLREEVGNTLTSASGGLRTSVAELSQLQTSQLESFGAQLSTLTRTNEEKLERVRNTVEERLTLLQFENARKLEEVRQTVDEKLQGTLEAKLGESFRLVSERLEQVHKGLGEMQTLASGVGDLKKVLANVKTRGTLGEVQLQQLLDQILAPEQYAANVVTKEGSDERSSSRSSCRAAARAKRSVPAAHRCEVPARGLPAAERGREARRLGSRRRARAASSRTA
jgi:DNA recombination protein RmuC